MSLPDAFETRLLDACLAGDDPILAALRAQAAAATVARREHTGDGVRTYFEVPGDCPAVSSCPATSGSRDRPASTGSSSPGSSSFAGRRPL